MMYDIFISYSRDDSKYLEQICNVLNTYKNYYSFTYFIDREAIASSHDYLKRISEAIAQSKTMLFIASKNSTSSVFCSKELLFADKRKIVIHQYKIDNSVLPDDIELLLGTHHYRQASDFSVENMVQEVLSSALERKIESLAVLQSDVCSSFPALDTIFHKSKDNQNLKEDEHNVNSDYIDKKINNQPRLSYVKWIKVIFLLIIAVGSVFFMILKMNFDKTLNQEYFEETILPSYYQAEKAPNGYFDEEKKYVEGLACVRKDNMWGFINMDRLIVIPLVFEDVFAFNDGLAAVKFNGKWGFIDKVGHIIAEPKYESVSNFVNGFAGVELDGKFGYINKSGELIIPAIYDDIWAFAEGKAKVWKDGQSFHITTTGTRIK